MGQITGSRRTFVGGAVASVAALGAMAWLGRDDAVVSPAPAAPGTSSHTTLVSAVEQPASREIAQWSAAIGKVVRVSSSAAGVVGVIDMVYNVPMGGQLPAGVRQNAFVVHFLVDRAGAPAGNAMYAVDTPVDGLTQLFLKRGDDRGDKALLTALFA